MHFVCIVKDLSMTISFQNDVEMPIPKYFVHEHHKSLKQREAMLERILLKLGPQEKDVVSSTKKKYTSR